MTYRFKNNKKRFFTLVWTAQKAVLIAERFRQEDFIWERTLRIMTYRHQTFEAVMLILGSDNDMIPDDKILTRVGTLILEAMEKDCLSLRDTTTWETIAEISNEVWLFEPV